MPQLDLRPRRRDGHLSDYTALSAQVKEAGLLQRSHGYYVAVTAAWLAVLAALAIGSYLIGDSWWQLALAPLFAMVTAQFGFLGHDAAHRQIFASNKHNDFAALFYANLLVGMGLSWWQHKHNRHHASPNKIGTDPDIAPGAISFTNQGTSGRKTPLTRWLTRHQGKYFFALMTLLGLQMQLNSLRRLFSTETVKYRRTELVLLLVRHGVAIGFGFTVMSPMVAIAFLACAQMTLGLYFGLAFAPNHIGRPIVPETVKIDFLRRQVLMSRNLTGGRLVDVAMGGLNHQIEHHLFPSMSRLNLRRVAPMVRAHCANVGVEYHQTSLPQAYREVADFIDNVGIGEVDLWRCPLASSMGRT